MVTFENPNVKHVFDGYAIEIRTSLLQLRELIFEVARQTDGVGKIEESLRWGQPAYLTSQSKSGSTIRLGTPKTGGFAIYTHCQTTIMSDFQQMFGQDFTFDGNRAIIFRDISEIDEEKLRFLITDALTYNIK